MTANPLPENIDNGAGDGFSFQCQCDPDGKIGEATYIYFEGDWREGSESVTCGGCGLKYEYTAHLSQYLSVETKDGNRHQVSVG